MEDKVKKILEAEYKRVYNFDCQFNDELEELGNYVLHVEGLKMSSEKEHLPLIIKFNSPVNPSIEQILVAQYEKKESFAFSIDIFDNKRVMIQKWKIEDALIKELDFGKYDRYDDNIVTVEVNILAKIKLDF